MRGVKQRWLSEASERSFGIYVHYPLCVRRCGYCDFPTVVDAAFPQRAYADKVLEEARIRAADYTGLVASSLYFGGGTPSLWPPNEVERVIKGIGELVQPCGELEVTLEANPETVEEGLLRRYRDAGVNRLSLGIQSLDDGVLRRLGRDHSADDARRTVDAARQAGFGNVSCDLIVGVGSQTSQQVVEEAERLASLGPQHVSLYSLTLARAAPLRRAGVRPAEDDRMARLLEAGRESLESLGLGQYEVSNFALSGRHSRHNWLIWQGGAYLGLGATAHSLWFCGDRTVRQINPPTRRYLADGPRVGRPGHMAQARVRDLPVETARFETMMLGLRTVAGVDRAAYVQRFGSDPLTHFASGLGKARDLGLVQLGDDRIAPTRRGIWFADEVALLL